MKVAAIPLAFLLASLLVPIPARSKTDPLCGPLRAFVAGVGPDEHREIVFRTSWGAGFHDDPDTKGSISSARCEYGGYERGKAVCAVLIKDASVEFGNVNAIRALACISPDISFPRRIEFEHGEFSVRYGTEDRGASISVSYEKDPEVGGMALRIEADGY